jgi:putative transposase
MKSVLVSFLLTLRTAARSRAELQLEVLALRHQLQVLQRTRPRRVRLAKTDRWLWVVLSRIWTGWRTALVVVKPETVIAWHRQGFRLWWTWKSRRRMGRPTVPADVRTLIRTMSQANPRWGAPRIHGELRKLGIDVCETTVAKYMVRPRQPSSQTWRTFLRNHLGQIVAADFFVVPTVTYRLVFVLVLLAHDRRRIRHVAVTSIRRRRGRLISCARRFRGTRRLDTSFTIAITRSTAWGPPRSPWELTTCSRRHTRLGKIRSSSDLLDRLGVNVSIT